MIDMLPPPKQQAYIIPIVCQEGAYQNQGYKSLSVYRKKLAFKISRRFAGSWNRYAKIRIMFLYMEEENAKVGIRGI